jgi:neutral ceramidase
MTTLARCSACCLIAVATSPETQSHAATFKAGFARRDITPAKPLPMWGYGVRHNLLSKGVRDPLYAKAVVIDAGSQKLAIVGMDLGRAPRTDMMERIRAALKSDCGVGWVMIAGSHTHSGPVIELRDKPGEGKGAYDEAIAYTAELEKMLVDVIHEAAGNTRDARIGWGSAKLDRNRNRHSKIEPKPVDPELSVLRFDDLEGKPIALVVNFAAHPTMLSALELRFSADYPGQMMNEVQQALGAPCVFMQGAAGDLSVRSTPQTQGVEAFGKALAGDVLAIAKNIETRVPPRPSIEGIDETFTVPIRLDLQNPVIQLLFRQAFFPELAAAYLDNDIQKNTIHPHLTTVLVNGELALVGASGEFFSEHANRLKARSRAAKTLFFGCCNGHHMYFPTIEAAAEGGYGADPKMNWAALGAGEQMMDKALINIYTMMGKYKANLLGL